MSDHKQDSLRLSMPTAIAEKREVKRRNIPRVGRACDRCRLKKCKVNPPTLAHPPRAEACDSGLNIGQCDGRQPCQRCNNDNAICNATRRVPPPEKAFSKEDVKVLSMEHKQLSQGLQHLYQHVIQHQSWPGPHVQLDKNRQPLVHEILERIGVMGTDADSSVACTEEEEQVEEEGWTDAPPQTPSLSSSKSSISPVSYDASEAWIAQLSSIGAGPDLWVPVMAEYPSNGAYLVNNVFFTEPVEKEEFYHY
ncbi:hypothetical protein MMC26_003975 [Xylographa opegraphella]|nr:hypothetical protein [Xylographa opegraphella]